MKRLPNDQIQELFQSTRPRRGKGFLIRMTSQEFEDHRVCIIVPKKQVAKATDRNAIKRRIRSALQGILACKSASKYDILVLGSSRVQDYSYTQYVTELSNLLSLDS